MCNFKEFHIHDMDRPNDEPQVLLLSNLEREFNRLRFLVRTGDEHIQREMEISIQAGELVGKLYDAFRTRYNNPSSPEAQRSLNMLCVRLVFCLYAEDAGIFGSHLMFHDYLQHRGMQQGRRALIDLFRILDQQPSERDPYLAQEDPLLAAFPYVNGGLFSAEDIEIPPFNQEIYDLLLSHASADFDWSDISPTIFGAVFESTLNPDTRRKGGMHYTSIENIHKVIDPLFLDDLRAELDTICQNPVQTRRQRELKTFQQKLASLTFLDPACGSGNFLTETYLSLRQLENRVLEQLYKAQVVMVEGMNPIQVSIQQFYGIEINDFAVAVATTALWIAESQMMKKTVDIVHMNLDFLPLKTYTHIHEGNALSMDWESVVSKDRLRYIMGNPPFVGARLMSPSQKNDVLSIFGRGWKNVGNLDYVACWYKKACEMMQGTEIRSALVSTNSVTQGEAVANLWKPLFAQGAHFDFAYRTFRWDSEASIKAHVYCVIIGFSVAPNQKPKVIYTVDREETVAHIDGYLLDAPDVFVESQKKPICDVPEIVIGNMPIDGGALSDISPEEKADIVLRYPQSKEMFRRFIGAQEYLNNKERWCLWLLNISPAAIKLCPPVLEKVKRVKKLRAASKREATRKSAETPTLFQEIRHPDTEYIVVPKVSSERRRYIPMGFLSPDVIASDLAFLIPDASLYHFGVLTSNVHMGWMRAVCGRLEMRYRYSKDIVYNNFPWPSPTKEQRAAIEETAQAILTARALYPDCSLADLYDEVTMPAELRRAHQKNDQAVMAAYGFAKGSPEYSSEAACVAALMRMYQELTRW